MGVSLYWLPKEKGNYLDTGSRSGVYEILQNWRGMPAELDSSMIPVLHGMELADPKEPAWTALIDALRENDAIKVWGEW